MDLKTLMASPDTVYFGFRHNPKNTAELLDSTAEPKLPAVAVGRLASKIELKEFEGYLKFPSDYAERYYLLYEKYSSSPPTEEYIDKMKELERFIKAAESDDEKWFNWITKAENQKFIKVNTEYRLSKDLSNRKLWDLYLSYLKETNPKEMLLLYSKFCRYFPNDVELKRDYWKATKLHGPSYVKFEKLFDFEKPLVDNSFANFCRSCVIPCTDLRPLIRFSPENAQNQTFPFKSPLMKYILSTANGTVLSKLHQTCKYSFIKQPILPCYRFVLNNLAFRKEDEVKYEFVENSMEYRSNVSPPSYLKDLYITTSFYANNKNSTMLSNFINEKFYKCDAKHIEIKNQKLSEKEFDFLVGHGNVESCCLESVTILKENGALMEFNEIVAKMPKLRYVGLTSMKLTNEILEKLQQIPFQNKFLSCEFHEVDNIINPQTFFDFVKKNAAPISTFGIHFHQNVVPVDVKVFSEQVYNLMNNQWNSDQRKPKLVITSKEIDHVFPFNFLLDE